MLASGGYIKTFPVLITCALARLWCRIGNTLSAFKRMRKGTHPNVKVHLPLSWLVFRPVDCGPIVPWMVKKFSNLLLPWYQANPACVWAGLQATKRNTRAYVVIRTVIHEIFRRTHFCPGSLSKERLSRAEKRGLRRELPQSFKSCLKGNLTRIKDRRTVGPVFLSEPWYKCFIWFHWTPATKPINPQSPKLWNN